MAAIGDNPMVDFEDLYQSGFIAMTKAVKKYTPEKGAFSTWFVFYLQSAFTEATGFRSAKQQKDPIHSAISLDTPLSDDDEGTLQDLIASEINVEEIATGSVWRKQLHAALQAALETLEKRQADILRLEYFEGKTIQQIGCQLGISTEAVKESRSKAIQALRGNVAVIQILRPFFHSERKAPLSPCAIMSIRAEDLAARRNKLLGEKR